MDPTPPTLASRLAHCIALSALFLIVYGTCNYLTSLRPNVGSFYFQWERRIPFVPAFIVPYLSIDLFFVGGFFLCSTRRELRTLSRRYLLAYAVAAAIFLVWPLKFGFARPHVGGVFGHLCDWFWAADQPYNQFPSLHITLRTILAALYVRHTRGVLRWAVAVWFSLIGFSTLLVYQHHAIDVIGGFGLAWLCFYATDGDPWRLPVSPNKRIAAYYLVPAAASLGIASLWWPWTFLFAWPALALGLVAAAYLGLGPGIYRKSQGRHAPAAAMLMAPVTAGQWLSMRHYARRSPRWSEVADRVWIGRTLSGAEAREAIDAGVAAVVDLTVELPENRPFAALPGYRHVPVMNLTAPLPAQLDEAVAAIDAALAETPSGIVYVHCKAGYSRSAAVAGAWLVGSGGCGSAAEAIARLEAARPGIVIRPEARAAIQSHAARRG